MEFKDLENRVLKNAEGYGKEHDIEINIDFASLKLAEEVGEFYQALLIHLHKCRREKIVPEKESKAELAKELADVVGLSIIVADTLGINLERAVLDKWNKHLDEDHA